jgi:ABC-type dipeptide/oligopeptide/nickel transport system permease subunit/ABC-type transport system substrate-binding protein
MLARRSRRLLRDGSALWGLCTLVLLCSFAAIAPLVWGADPNHSDFDLARGPGGLLPGPSPSHPLGVDPLFRDVLARLAHGARLSLSIAFVATLTALAVGTAIGFLAGWLAGGRLRRIDDLCMRAVDIALAFPYLLLITAVGVAIERSSAVSVTLILGLTGWTGVARLVRAKTLEIKAQDYVQAARALGAPPSRLALRHVLPGLSGSLLVLGSHLAAQMILAEAVLGYLTVGIQAPQPTWGRMLHEAETHLGAQPLLVAVPGATIVLTVLALTRLGDGLRDAIDVHEGHRGRRWLRALVDVALVGLVALLGTVDPQPLSPPEPAPVARATPRHGGVLRLALQVGVHSLDPAVAYDEAARAIMDLLYARLVTFDPRGELEGDIADGINVLEGGRRYRFHLRPGVRFHDGALLRADDVKRSLERMLHRDTPSGGAHLYERIEGFAAYRDGTADDVAGIVVRSSDELDIGLIEPDASFLSLLTLPFAAPVCRSLGASYVDEPPAPPCGSGAYRLERFDAEGAIAVTRFAAYALPRRYYPDRIEWLLEVPARSQRHRFEAGELDLITELTGVDGTRFASDAAWRGQRSWVSRPVTNGFFLNTERPPLDNRHLRRAIAYALDPSVLEKVHPGVTEVTRILPSGVPGPPSEPPMRRHDRELALAEMSLAGYAYQPESGRGGLPEPLEYLTIPDTFEQSAAEIFQQQLATIGIRLELRLVSFPAWLALTSRRGAAQAGWRAWQADYPDPSNFFESLFTTASIRDDGSQNVSFFSHRELDDVVQAAHRETDRTQRMALYQRAEEIVRDEAPWVPVYSYRTLHLWQARVQGYAPHPIEPLALHGLWLAEESR